MILAETYWTLLRNWPHWMFELTVEAATGIGAWLLGRPFFRRWLKRHDAEEHTGWKHGPWCEGWDSHGPWCEANAKMAVAAAQKAVDSELASKVWQDLIVWGQAHLWRDERGDVHLMDPARVQLMTKAQRDEAASH